MGTESTRTSTGQEHTRLVVGAYFDRTTGAWGPRTVVSTLPPSLLLGLRVYEVAVAGSGDKLMVSWRQEAGLAAPGPYYSLVTNGVPGPNVHFGRPQSTQEKGTVFGHLGGDFGLVVWQQLSDETGLVTLQRWRDGVTSAPELVSSVSGPRVTVWAQASGDVALSLGLRRGVELDFDGVQGPEYEVPPGTLSWYSATTARLPSGERLWIGGGDPRLTGEFAFRTVTGTWRGPFYAGIGGDFVIPREDGSIWLINAAGFQLAHADGTTDPVVEVAPSWYGAPAASDAPDGGGVMLTANASLTGALRNRITIEAVRFY